MVDNFDLNLLRVFDAIWREGQVTRAAHTLGLSQSAVSAALQRLREHVGDPLFIKGRHGMRPTPYAERMAEEVSATLDHVRHRILVPPVFDPRHSERWFTLCTSDLGELALMPALLQHCAEVAPGVRLRTMTGTLSQRLQALERGEADLVVGHYPEIQGADVMQRLLAHHGHLCLARRGHPALRDATITTEAYLEAHHAVLRDEARRFDAVDQHLRARGLRRQVSFVASHFLSIPQVVATTHLIATVPAATRMLFDADPRLQTVELPFALPRFGVKMYWHRKSHEDAAARWLRQTLVAVWGKVGKG